MIAIKQGGVRYAADLRPSGVLFVSARFQFVTRKAVLDEHSARRWLGDLGLRRGRIKRLLDAVCRGEGDYVNPDHPKRVK